MKLINLSAEPLWRLRSWMPSGLEAEHIAFFPDACPGKSPLPTGTAVLTRQDDWRRYALSDCGCGMLLLRSELAADDLDARRWNMLADALRANKGGLGDLGGGNHFLDALRPHEDGPIHFLIHTGSRAESGHVDHLVARHDEFDAEFDRVVDWARENRAAVGRAVASIFGRVEVLLDMPHNTYQKLAGGGAIIRKGSVHVVPGELAVIPSHMSGDVVLVRAGEMVGESLGSLSHGTGRTMSRGDCKPLAESFDFASLRRRVMIPDTVTDLSLRTEGPYAYRDLDECLLLLDGYIEEVARFRVIGYMGHL